MYSVTMGYDAAVDRIKSLLKNRYNSEALVTSVFTAEKTLRRTLRQLIVSSGFISRHADDILKRLGGLHAVGESWYLYDPANRRLVDIVRNRDWQIIAEAAKMRNNMIHGISV